MFALLLFACTGADDKGADTAAPAPLPTLANAGVAIRGDAGDLAGASVAAGDLDGDGADELIVGALGGRRACVVAAPFDDADAALDAAVCLGQAENYDFVGQAVAAGDLDGDGAAELLVGAPGSDAGAADAGAVWRVDGLPTADGSVAERASASWVGAFAADAAGSAVAFAGDADGDGAGDVLIGAPGSDLGGREGGAVYLVAAGGGPMASDAHAIFTGAGSEASPAKHAENVLGDGVGGAMCAADLDGDGVVDLALGAPGWDGGAENAGALALFTGPVAPGTRSVGVADTLLVAERAGGYAGGALACGGDTDGDGVGELLVGADADGGGRVYLWRGGALADGPAFQGAGDEQAGYDVAFVARLDAPAAVAVGAAGADDPAVDAGAVAVFGGPFGAATYALADADARYTGEGAGDFAGFALAGLVGADAVPRLAVGAPYNRDPAPIGGVTYVLEVRTNP
jgi:hypothetical protein